MRAIVLLKQVSGKGDWEQEHIFLKHPIHARWYSSPAIPCAELFDSEDNPPQCELCSLALSSCTGNCYLLCRHKVHISIKNVSSIDVSVIIFNSACENIEVCTSIQRDTTQNTDAAFYLWIFHTSVWWMIAGSLIFSNQTKSTFALEAKKGLFHTKRTRLHISVVQWTCWPAHLKRPLRRR